LESYSCTNYAEIGTIKSNPNLQGVLDTLPSGSVAIDTGRIYPGLTYNGFAPDAGWWEFGSGGPTNLSPVANAGSDSTLAYSRSSTVLTGSGSDADGTVVAYSWTKLSGPSATIVSPASSTTSVTGLTPGTYIFQLTVTDNLGATHSSTVTVTVTGPPELPTSLSKKFIII